MSTAQTTGKPPRKPPGKPVVRAEAEPVRKPKPKAKAKKPGIRRTYEDLDWLAIRREWESTEVSITALRKRYGIRSDRTMRDRILAEGWAKNIDAITANLVQAGIAATMRDPLSPLFDPAPPRPQAGLTIEHEPDPEIPDADIVEDAGAESAHPPTPSIGGGAPPKGKPLALSAPGMPDVEAFAAAVGPSATELEAKRQAEDAESARSTKGKKRKEFSEPEAARDVLVRGGELRRPRPRTSPPPTVDSARVEAGSESVEEEAAGPLLSVPTADEVAVRTAQDLANLHIQAAAEQITNANRLSLVGNVVLARIMVALGPDSEEAGEARGALMSLNPDKETFTGLLKAVGDTLEKAAVMKRRALSMDPKTNGATPTAATLPAGVPRTESDLAQLMKGMPPDVLKQLRGASAALAKLRPKAPDPAPEPQPEGKTTP